MIHSCAHGNGRLVIIFLTLSVIFSSVQAAVVNFYWYGNITGVTSFADGATPEGIILGAAVEGQFTVNTDDSAGHRYIQGNTLFGSEFHYSDGLLQTVKTEGGEWAVGGGDLTFYHESPLFGLPEQLAYNVWAATDTAHLLSFPKYVGDFEIGFALFDNKSPLDLFGENLDRVQVPNLPAITFGSGSVSSRLWDTDNNIVDGYFFDFNISAVSPVPIPESSSYGFCAASVAFVFASFGRWRRRCLKTAR